MSDEIVVTAYRTPSQRIGQFIRSYESCVLTAYKPTPNDVWTIGWGHTDHVVPGLVWTPQLALSTFMVDLAQRGAAVAHLLGAAMTSQTEFDAMVSLTYNIGVAGLAGHTLLRYHLAGNKSAAANEFLKWDHQNGKVLAGLTERRQRERDIYLNGVYKDHNS